MRNVGMAQRVANTIKTLRRIGVSDVHAGADTDYTGNYGETPIRIYIYLWSDETRVTLYSAYPVRCDLCSIVMNHNGDTVKLTDTQMLCRT